MHVLRLKLYLNYSNITLHYYQSVRTIACGLYAPGACRTPAFRSNYVTAARRQKPQASQKPLSNLMMPHLPLFFSAFPFSPIACVSIYDDLAPPRILASSGNIVLCSHVCQVRGEGCHGREEGTDRQS